MVPDVEARGDVLLHFGEHPPIPAERERHLVQVGRELREGELAGAELFLEADGLVPRLESIRPHWRLLVWSY